MIDIDASKGFVDLWVHLSFAIFAIFDLKRQLKLLEMACDQVQTCLIFPFMLEVHKTGFRREGHIMSFIDSLVV